MKRSSIYNKVTNYARKSDCSFGAGGGFKQQICVGWGSSDSHKLAEIEVTESVGRRVDGKYVRTFRMFVNGHLIREGVHADGKCRVDWVL